MNKKRLDGYIPMDVESLLGFMTGKIPVLFDGCSHVLHYGAHLCHRPKVRKNVNEPLEGSEIGLLS